MYPIQIRVGGSNGAPVDFDTAVKLAMGANRRITMLNVTAVYAEETDTGQVDYAKRPVIYPEGAPVFGLDADLYCRRTASWGSEGAQVQIGGLSSHSPEVAQVRIACYSLAAQIAAAANAAAAAIGDAGVKMDPEACAVCGEGWDVHEDGKAGHLFA